MKIYCKDYKFLLEMPSIRTERDIFTRASVNLASVWSFCERNESMKFLFVTQFLTFTFRVCVSQLVIAQITNVVVTFLAQAALEFVLFLQLMTFLVSVKRLIASE